MFSQFAQKGRFQLSTRFFSSTALRLSSGSYGSKAAERLAGKTVLITGASAGIGQATALELAAAANGNLKLILAARRTERLTELKKTLEAKYPSVQVLSKALDVSQYDKVPEFVQTLPQEFADIDVLINNAGLVKGLEKVGTIAQQDIDTMFRTNVFGLVALTQTVLPILKAKNRGDVVNIGSVAGLEAYAGGSIYCATKAAVRSFTQALRRETLDTRVRILEIDPGAVETEFSVVRFRGDENKASEVYEGLDPLVATDVAEMIVFGLTRRETVVVAETVLVPSSQASALSIHRET